MTKKIAIDAGHGLNTSGKRTPDGEREWTFNDKVADAFWNTLRDEGYTGYEIKRFDDTTGKTDVPLKDRTDKANAWGADVFISFHHNGLAGKWGNHTGVQVHVYETKPAGSVKLAKLVLPEVVKAYGLRDRGIIYNDLHITRETHCDSILIEGGFMDSTIDIKKLRDNEVLKNAGKGIAHAVAEFLGLKKEVKVAAAPKKTTVAAKKDTGKTTSYKVVKGDTLSEIAEHFDMTVKELKALNKLSSDLIRIGQVLKVDASYKTGTATSDVWVHNKADFNKSSQAYVLKKGKKVTIYGEKNGLYNIGTNAYVSKKYIK